MKNILNGFLLALSYFTILPSKKNIDINDKTYKYMLLSFPLIGLILGSLSILAFLFFERFYIAIYAAFISSIIYIVLYGLLHLEAICEVVNAWMAKSSGDAVHDIMKERYLGVNGVIACFCFVLLKVAIFTYLLYERKFEVILIVLMFSRLNLIFALNYFEFHKKSFLAISLKKQAKESLMFISLIYFLIAIFININISMLFVISVCICFFTLKILEKRFGFLNGHCIGFSIEKAELVLLNLGLLFI
ncbi:MAG: adenosylcobinamide-GDP ribazoletransferase [Campylobacterales bacterium]|nr:adenosylcobinamide-GDP ribazoletransferase [Campylobacterales bacterium]